MQISAKRIIERRVTGDNVWLSVPANGQALAQGDARARYDVLKSENDVGRAMFQEIVTYADQKAGDIIVVLLGGRGAQAMYKLVRQLTENGEIDELLGRLHVFTQDALAPMRMGNSLSFVRDFERLLGPTFFEKIKSFTPMLTEAKDLEGALTDYVQKLESLGGIDIFFIGFGREAEAASHLCYIKPGCGAGFKDYAGIIPISPSILEHHISKFKAGGSDISEADEIECRNASYILTLGPAAILGAKLIVQSIVDASTAPGKRESFKRLIETNLAADVDGLQRQCEENPGLLVRLHNNYKTFVLSDLLT